MPTYLHRLFQLKLEGRKQVSSTELAEYMNIELIVARKDIALTGITGQRRVGYSVDELIDYIRAYLGWTEPITATLFGAGALGSAILGYDDFRLYGLKINSIFDISPEKIGKIIHGHKVLDCAEMEKRLAASPPDIGILCVSSPNAQSVADRLAAIGVKYIWNFASVCLKVPPGVIVQREVIAGGLAMLTVKMKNVRSGQVPIEE